jgi:hypothetical protein
MNNVNETIDLTVFAKTHRPFDDMQGLVKALMPLVIVQTWGAHNWYRMSEHILRFTVNGHHHRGHVYIIPNASDLFDIYLTSNRGTIKHKFEDIFVDSLVDTIDGAVERIPEYKH